MGRKNLEIFFVFLIILASVVSSTQGRKLFNAKYNTAKKTPSLDESLYLNILPKGTVPPSTPSNKGHSVPIDEKLVKRHLGVVDRILGSVPSPGVGH